MFGGKAPKEPSQCRQETLNCVLFKQTLSTQKYRLKGLSHEIDFKNFDENLQNLT